MSIKFDKIEPGMILLDIHSYRMGNSTMRELGLWRVLGIDPTKIKYTFVIDTDTYSGNFERPIFSFITGMSESCGERAYATYEAEAARKALKIKGEYAAGPLDELVEERIRDPGDDGYHRSYVSITVTPGFYNVHGEHFPAAYSGKFKKQSNCSDCKEGKPAEQHRKWPAYQSVAIFLRRRPTDEEIKLIKTRALAYKDFPRQHEWDARPNIIGFRLVVSTTTHESETL
jgi:hypothetical protein